MPDRYEQVKAKIAAASMVLVGLGEEFAVRLERLEEKPEYRMACQKIVQNLERFQWIKPFLERDYLQRYPQERLREAYRALQELLTGKNYFVITTCMDGWIWQSGLNPERIVAPCGGYVNLQCRAQCTPELVEAKETADAVWRVISAGKWEELSCPRCSHCGQELQFNNIHAEKYNESGYLPAWELYTKWLKGTLNRELCILELGVGMDYSSVIRFPFEKAAFFNQKSDFIRVHKRLFQMAEELKEKGISIEEAAPDFLRKCVSSGV